MHTVTRRHYDVDDDGVRFLLYRPGDVITDAEEKRIATLVKRKPDTRPGWMRLLERRPAPAVETPTAPLGAMKLAELRAVCASEGIEADGANLRADLITIICGARARRRSNER